MQSIQLFLQSLSNSNYKLYFDYFFGKITIESALKFLVLYFFIVWISIIVWVYKDITNRTNSTIYQIISLLLVLIFTPFGVFIYLLIRPIRTITEKYYDEIEDNLDILSEAITHTVIPCPNCKKEINSHYSFCPHCDFSLFAPCKWCGKSVSFDWNSCPHCGKKVKKKVIHEDENKALEALSESEKDDKKEKDKEKEVHHTHKEK